MNKLHIVFFALLFLFLSHGMLMSEETDKESFDVEYGTGKENTKKNDKKEESKKKKKKKETYIIRVTAQKRKQSIQDVPGSVTGLNVNQIEDAGINSSNEVHTFVPNMMSLDFGSGFSYYSIRGQSNINSYSSAVGIYVDGVPIIGSGMFTDASVYNAERIEILRGPQGNLYGLNSSGGVINIITKKPDNYWTGSASGSYGNFNAHTFMGSVSGPVVKDKLYMGFSGTYTSQDAYLQEAGVATAKSTTGHGRYQMLITPVKDLKILFTAGFGSIQSDAIGWIEIDDDPFSNTDNGMADATRRTTNSQSLHITYSTPWFDITSTTSRQYSDFTNAMSMDFTGANQVYTNWSEISTAWTEELRFTSNNKKDPFQWLLGVFYNNNTSDLRGNGYYDDYWYNYVYYGVTTGTAGVYDKDYQKGLLVSNIASVFAQASYTFFEKLTLTAGIRYDYKHEILTYYHEFDGTEYSDYTDPREWHGYAPRATLDYRPIKSLMVYISAAKGYKAGGHSAAQADNVDHAVFDPEDSWTFEAGIKSNWWKNRIIANITGFFTISDNMQMFYYDGTTYQYSNGGKAYLAGAEAELMVRPVAGLEIMATFGYTYSTVAENAVAAYIGNQIPFTPMFQVGSAIQYTFDFGLFLRGQVSWSDKVYFEESNTNSQENITILNFNLGYKGENIKASFFIHNTLGTVYYTYKTTIAGTAAGRIGSPRTFGGQISLEF